MLTVRNAARERLEQGELALGAGIKLARTVEIAKLMKTAGYDWLFIDLEHGAMSLDNACQISVAALDAGLAPIVRVPSGEYSMATRALDNGALGIVLPHVNSVDEARRAVERLKFPPMGHRSIAGALPQLDYQSVKTTELVESLNAASLVIAMIESPEAVEIADQIAAVPGIDILLIGTNDLCAEMGIHGDVGNPRVVEAYKQVGEACRKHNKWLGMGGVYIEDIMQRYIGLGVRLILSGNDLTFLLAASKARAGFLRKIAL
ncbi:MAG: aldolase [Chloroflexi bacterium]|nr:aldolase [Chloroflexota bacterium]